MSNSLYISIPCEYNGKTLIIKGLGLQGNGDDIELALLDAIRNTAFYDAMELASVNQFTDFRGRDFAAIEIPFDTMVYDTITQLEPMPETKKKKQIKSFLSEATPEETLKFGF